MWFDGVELQNFTGTHSAALTPPGSGVGWVSWETLAVLEGAGEGAGDPPANPLASPDAKAEKKGAVWVPPTLEEFVYDAAGNRESSAQWYYGWDAKNQLTRILTKNHDTAPQAYDIRFTYDSEGRRVQKHVIEYQNGGVASEKIITFIWDGWDLMYERHQLPSGLTLLERKYLWGPDIAGGSAGGAGGLLLIREIKGNSTTSIIPLYDGTGHVVALTNLDKDLLGEYAYGPFGERIHATGPMANSNPWRWATKYLDEETGLYYFGHRFYDPITGQWLSREPLGESESINLYQYTAGDPINNVDVLGLYLTKVSVDRIRLQMFLAQLAKDPTSLPVAPSSDFSELPILKYATNAEELGIFNAYNQDDYDRAFIHINGAISPQASSMSWSQSEANRRAVRFQTPQWNPSQTRSLNLGAANTPLNASINSDWLLPAGAGMMGARLAAQNLKPVLPMLRSGMHTELNVISNEARFFQATGHSSQSFARTSPYQPSVQRNIYNDALSMTMPPFSGKNVRLAGQRHPVTGIVFDNRGYLIFDDIAVFETTISNKVFRSSSYTGQMQLATQDLWSKIQSGVVARSRYNSTQMIQIQNGAAKIDGFTWHHHQHTGRMQLVPFDIHSKTGHIGWEAISRGL